jgi:uncharacterized membrane protein
MGPSIMAAAMLWDCAKTSRGRLAAFAGTTVALTLLTPIIRSLSVLRILPDPIEAYIRPIPGLTNFVFFPWSGFVFAGTFLGLLLDSTRTRGQERGLNIWFGLGGTGVAMAAYVLSFLPSPYASSNFWTTSPCFFFLRTSLIAALIALAFAWESRPGGRNKFSPMQQLGRTSLFIYWIHVEMIYGLISLPLHKALTLREAWVAYALFTLFMLGCSLTKHRVVEWWNVRRAGRSGSLQARAT